MGLLEDQLAKIKRTADFLKTSYSLAIPQSAISGGPPARSQYNPIYSQQFANPSFLKSSSNSSNIIPAIFSTSQKTNTSTFTDSNSNSFVQSITQPAQQNSNSEVINPINLSIPIIIGIGILAFFLLRR